MSNWLKKPDGRNHGQHSTQEGEGVETHHREARQKLKRELVEHFKKRTLHKNIIAKAYIRYFDLRNLWDDESIKVMLYPFVPTDEVLKRIREEMYIILSIL